MSVRLIYEQTLSGALAGWIGHDLASRVAEYGPPPLAGALIGGSIGFLANVPAARRLAGGPAARMLVLGAAVGAVSGAIGLGFPFGLMVIPRFLGVLIGALAVGLSLGAARWPGTIGVRAGLLGGLLGGLAMSAVALAGIGPAATGAASLGAFIGFALALPASLGDNASSTSMRGRGVSG